MSAAITARDVAAIRRNAVIFAGLSFAMRAGDAALVTGPNGAGKSTLLRIVAGLLPAAAGSIDRGDATLALLTEASALDEDRPLRSALDYWAWLDRLPAPETRVSTALAALALTPLADVPVRLLSTGQRRRGGLARVIASGATLWLLDEPANGLDTASLALLADAIAAHRAQGGMAMIATHLPMAVPAAQTIVLGTS